MDSPPSDWEIVGSIPRQVKLKSFNTVTAASLLGTQNSGLDLVPDHPMIPGLALLPLHQRIGQIRRANNVCDNSLGR